MAKRSYLPEDLVELPVRDTNDTLVLTAQLLTAAQAEDQAPDGKGQTHPLPAPVASARDDIASERAALEEVSVPEPPRPAGVRAADKVEDNAVNALHGFLSAFLRLPEDHPQRGEAAAIFAVFFGDGSLEFITWRPIKEWAEVEKRLKALDAAGLEPRLAALGGKVFLDHLRTAHVAYGRALGITEAPPAEMPANVRERLDALLRAVRIYVVRVGASRDDKHPATLTRAVALLRPLAEWDSPPPARAEKKPADTVTGG